MSWNRRYVPKIGTTANGQIQLWKYNTAFTSATEVTSFRKSVDLTNGVSPPMPFARVLPGVYYWRVVDYQSAAEQIEIGRSVTFQLKAQRC
jgi:hypothetical protein